MYDILLPQILPQGVKQSGREDDLSLYILMASTRTTLRLRGESKFAPGHVMNAWGAAVSYFHAPTSLPSQKESSYSLNAQVPERSTVWSARMSSNMASEFYHPLLPICEKRNFQATSPHWQTVGRDRNVHPICQIWQSTAATVYVQVMKITPQIHSKLLYLCVYNSIYRAYQRGVIS